MQGLKRSCMMYPGIQQGGGATHKHKHKHKHTHIHYLPKPCQHVMSAYLYVCISPIGKNLPGRYVPTYLTHAHLISIPPSIPPSSRDRAREIERDKTDRTRCAELASLAEHLISLSNRPCSGTRSLAERARRGAARHGGARMIASCPGRHTLCTYPAWFIPIHVGSFLVDQCDSVACERDARAGEVQSCKNKKRPAGAFCGDCKV